MFTYIIRNYFKIILRYTYLYTANLYIYFCIYMFLYSRMFSRPFLRIFMRPDVYFSLFKTSEIEFL